MIDKTIENQKLIAENEQLRRSLERANEIIGRFEILKSKILKMLSHDLRTPLASIRGYSELLKSGAKGQLTEAQKKLAGIAIQEADHLNGLISDSQDLFLLEAGQLKLDKQPIPFEELAQKALLRVQLISELKEIPVETELESPLPVVDVDAARMIQVLANILRGALKNTPKGGRVTLSAAPINGIVEVKIAQMGPGISAEQLSNGTQDGFHIALALAREIVHAHGGEMDVERTGQNEGTTFWIRLPILRISPPIV